VKRTQSVADQVRNHSDDYLGAVEELEERHDSMVELLEAIVEAADARESILAQWSPLWPRIFEAIREAKGTTEGGVE
jgi:hypothetical protein